MSIHDREARAATFGLEARNMERLEERILTALLVPYGETSMDTPYPNGERFLPGSFRKAVAEWRSAKRPRPLLLFRSHDHGKALGQAVSLEDTPEGPVAEFRITTMPHGEEAIQEYREGLLSGISVGFRAVRDKINPVDGAREVVEASLLEASILPMGAYAGAGVLAMRHPAKPVDLSWATLPPAPAVDPSLGFRIR
jgi:HK97 family phage prohead protease